MQYRQGTVEVENGSSTVVFTGAEAGAELVGIGHLFKTDRDGDAVYQIAARTPATGASLTSIQLTAPYGGVDGVGLFFQIVSDFTFHRGYPRPAQGDADAADWLSAALDQIDTDMAALLGGGSSLSLGIGGVVYRGTIGMTNNPPQFAWDELTSRLILGVGTPQAKLTVHTGTTVDGVRIIGQATGLPLLAVYDGTATFQFDTRDSFPRIWTDAATINFYESSIWRMALDNGRLLLGTLGMSAGGGAVGEIVIQNGKRYRALNATGDTAFALIGLDASNRVVLAADGQTLKIGTPPIALGLGAMATLGAVGTGGPVSSAQAGWLPFILSTGAVGMVPYWLGP